MYSNCLVQEICLSTGHISTTGYYWADNNNVPKGKLCNVDLPI